MNFPVLSILPHIGIPTTFFIRLVLLPKFKEISFSLPCLMPMQYLSLFWGPLTLTCSFSLALALSLYCRFTIPSIENIPVVYPTRGAWTTLLPSLGSI
jgi:hypothetical protein